jgi:hypothetical protein
MWPRPGLLASNASIAFGFMPDDKLPQQGGIYLVKRLSIEEVFAWTQSFVAREWRLLIPVVLAFLVFPPLMMDLLVPQQVTAGFASAVQTQNPQAFAAAMRILLPIMALVLLIATYGGLTISAIALVPGISVREALTLALRRLPIMVGAVLMVAAAQLVLATILTVIFAAMHQVGAGAQSMLVGIVMAVSLFATIRLITLAPMIVTRRVSVTSAIRESWHISQGAFWRIMAAVMIYAIGAMVVMIALDYAVGILLTLSAQAVGAAELGRALTALFQRSVGGALALGLHLLIAAIFRQLSDAPIRGI